MGTTIITFFCSPHAGGVNVQQGKKTSNPALLEFMVTSAGTISSATVLMSPTDGRTTPTVFCRCCPPTCPGSFFLGITTPLEADVAEWLDRRLK